MAFFHSPRLVTDGLVLCLDAANPKSYAGSGTTWKDLSGNGNDGTLTNNPTFDSGSLGSFSFDGVDDFISIPSQLDAQSPLTGYGSFTGADTDAFTLEIWIKTSQTSTGTVANSPKLIGRDNSDIYAALSLNGGYVCYIHFNNGWFDNLKSTTMVANNIWHQVVYVNNSNETGVLYIDGVSEASGSSSLSGTNYFSPDHIGRGYNSQYYQGSVGSCKFYDRSLSAEEVLQNYNATKSRFI